jgi:outer membrane lipoprotein-sorting protein
VEFVVDADRRIHVVKVTGFDHSMLEFRFEEERVDPTLDAKLFQFQTPKGAQLVEAGQ